MMAAAEQPEQSGPSLPVDELCEDIDVAIREFLERYPQTDRRRIRQAIRRVERSADGGSMRWLAAVLSLLAAVAVGLALGLALG